MKTSKNGLALIKGFEGLSLKPYRCPAGVPTIGYGSTVYFSGQPVRMGDRAITEDEAERILQLTLVKYEDAVNRYVQVPINQNEFDALVSFAYNCGIGNLQKSTLLKKVNARDFIGAADEFMKWVYAAGKRMKGLFNRRTAERGLFLKEYVA